MLNRSEIIATTLYVFALATIFIGIYNCVIYQNVSNNLATGSLAYDSDTIAIDTSTATSTSATTAIATSIATDVVTTNPPEGCTRMLPFGYNAGDNVTGTLVQVGIINSCVIWNKTLESLPIKMNFQTGAMTLGDILILNIYGVHSTYFASTWSGYYRNVTSKEEQDAIACLVNHPAAAVEAIVFTWLQNPTQENEKLQIFQIILAILDHVSTYVIRIYSDNLPASVILNPVLILYSGEEIQKFFKDVAVESVRGQRQIFDVTPATGLNDNLTVVEEGKNCPIIC